MAKPRITVPNGSNVRTPRSILSRITYGAGGIVFGLSALGMLMQGELLGAGILGLIALSGIIPACSKYRDLS